MNPSDLIAELERLAKRHELQSAKFLGLGQKGLAALANAKAAAMREAIEVVQEQAANTGEVAGA